MNDLTTRVVRWGWPGLTIAGLTAGAATKSWFSGSVGFGEINVGLLKAEACVMGTCESGDLCELMACQTQFTTISTICFIAMLGAIVGMVVNTLLREFNDDDFFSKYSFKLCGGVVMLTLATWMFFPSMLGRAGIGVSWGFWLTLLCAISGCVYSLISTATLLPFSYDATNVAPIRVKANYANTDIAGSVPVARISASVQAPVATDMPDVADLEEKSLHELPFQSPEVLLNAQAVTSPEQQIKWGDVDKLIIRRLPKNYGGEIILDVVPSITTGMSKPIRITRESSVNFDFLGVEDRPFVEQIRYFCQFLEKNVPGVIEDRSRHYVSEGDHPPEFTTNADLKAYNDSYF